MSEFITLTCSSCGGALEITSDTEQFVCQYCKRKHIIKRSGGTIFLDGLAQVITGVDRTGSEMAIVRLKEEIPVLENRRVNRLKEFQARDTYLLGVESEVKRIEKEKRRAYSDLAIYAVLAVIILVVGIALTSIILIVFGVLFALGTLAQSLKVRYAVRKLNDLKRKQLQMLNDSPKQKELFDRDIKAIDSEIAKKKRELVNHQMRVSV